MDTPVRDMTFLDQMSVFVVFHGSMLVFHGFRSIFMVFHGSRLVFHGPRLFHGFSLFQVFFMVPVGFSWIFMV